MDSFIAFYIFILAAVTGYEIISKAPVILHTTLISASSFIQGIVLVGAMIVLGTAETTSHQVIGFIAVALATANAVGGFLITKRMFAIFQKNDSYNIEKYNSPSSNDVVDRAPLENDSLKSDVNDIIGEK